MALKKCKECGKDVSTEAESCPNCGAKVKRKSIGCGGAIVVFVILAAIVGIINNANKTDLPSTSAPDPKNKAMSDLKIKDIRWHKGGFGSVMLADFTISNEGKVNVKDLEITCELSAKSGTGIDKNKRTIYEIFEAGKTKKIKEFNMGFVHSQAQSTNCYITDLSLQ